MFELTGKQAQEALDRAGITCNKNAIPNDPEKPFVTSGLRLGTAAVTTAGMREPEMREIAGLMAQVLRKTDDEHIASDVKQLRGDWGYGLARARPVDMFPHTPHVEAVALLTRG